VSDILWQDTSGDIALWQMNGFSVAANALVGFADPSWHIIPPDSTGATTTAAAMPPSGLSLAAVAAPSPSADPALLHAPTPW
jgi:hypothetical protein